MGIRSLCSLVIICTNQLLLGLFLGKLRSGHSFLWFHTWYINRYTYLLTNLVYFCWTDYKWSILSAMNIGDVSHIIEQPFSCYVWAKRTSYLLAVIYRSPRRHSNSSKTFKKNRKKCKHIFMTILGPAINRWISDRDVIFLLNLHYKSSICVI